MNKEKPFENSNSKQPNEEKYWNFAKEPRKNTEIKRTFSNEQELHDKMGFVQGVQSKTPSQMASHQRNKYFLEPKTHDESK